MLQEDRHLTIEQLSVFLDQELSAQEQADCQTHLDGCEACRNELMGLRQMVALLRALPPVEPPREFLLPVDHAPGDKEQGEEARLARHSRRLRVLRVAVRTMSTLAAVIGAFFLLSTLLAVLPAPMQGTATSSSGASYSTSENANKNTPSVGQTQPQAAATSQDLSTTSSPTATPDQSLPPLDLSSRPPTIFIFDLNTPGGRAGTGILLLMFGVMGLVLTRRGDRL